MNQIKIILNLLSNMVCFDNFNLLFSPQLQDDSCFQKPGRHQAQLEQHSALQNTRVAMPVKHSPASKKFGTIGFRRSLEFKKQMEPPKTKKRRAESAGAKQAITTETPRGVSCSKKKVCELPRIRRSHSLSGSSSRSNLSGVWFLLLLVLLWFLILPCLLFLF